MGGAGPGPGRCVTLNWWYTVTLAERGGGGGAECEEQVWGTDSVGE